LEERAVKVTVIVALALLSAAFVSPAANAEDWQKQDMKRQIDEQNQQACMNDAMTLCGQFIPDRDRVASCLLSNRRRVSLPCRTALTHWHG
jgi:hypothetical protein